jgi:hypothetical protein
VFGRLEESKTEDASWDDAVKWVPERKFLAPFSRVSPPLAGEKQTANQTRESNHARMTLQDLLEVLRKRRARHHDVCAGILRLLL